MMMVFDCEPGENGACRQCGRRISPGVRVNCRAALKPPKAIELAAIFREHKIGCARREVPPPALLRRLLECEKCGERHAAKCGDRDLTEFVGLRQQECRWQKWTAYVTPAKPAPVADVTASDTLDPRLYVTTARLVEDTLRLAADLPAGTSGVVGIARSGMLPASVLSSHLHLPLWSLGDLRYQNRGVVPLGHGWRHDEPRRAKLSGPLVVVDDTVAGGHSAQWARAAMANHMPGADYVLAAVYVNPEHEELVDLYAWKLPLPHWLEWNLFNSVHAPNLACDLDGVICENGWHNTPDEAARVAPKHLPRLCEIPAIVTARPESLRRATEAWLAKHGVRCKRLAMWPGEAASREHDLVAAFKAGEYAAMPEAKLYVESEPELARRIAQLSGKLVLCPAIGRVLEAKP